MQEPITEAEFERVSWHDCHIWGVALHVGDPDENDWTSDLVLDIDYIVEWMCGIGGGGMLRVAPATLVFHGATELRILIDWGNNEFQVALHGLSIDRIDRERTREQKVYLDRPYYRWRILLNWPQGGEIAFGAAGFTQTLVAEPVLRAKQHFSHRERNRLIKR